MIWGGLADLGDVKGSIEAERRTSFMPSSCLMGSTKEARGP